MKKRILLISLLFLLFSVSFVSARICDTDNVLDVLRKALYIYYTNPKGSSFTPDELKDLLGFYVGIQTGQITVDCTTQSENIDKANILPDNIPSCSDGTKYGKCSTTKPKYCDNGVLLDNPNVCGCNTGYVYDSSTNNCLQWSITNFEIYPPKTCCQAGVSCTWNFALSGQWANTPLLKCYRSNALGDIRDDLYPYEFEYPLSNNYVHLQSRASSAPSSEWSYTTCSIGLRSDLMLHNSTSTTHTSWLFC